MVGFHVAVWAPPFLLLFSAPSCGAPGLRSLAYFSEFRVLTRMEDLAPILPKQKYKVPSQGETLVLSEKQCP